jgi:hypothetical protein
MKEQLDKIYKVKIYVSGFSKVQAEGGLPDLLAEISSRPWLYDSQAYWDDSRNALVIVVGYELEDRLEERALDEIGDCVMATMQFDEKIEFDIQRL